MSRRSRPTIELTGEYDDLERSLTRFLDLPVLLIRRDWKKPERCDVNTNEAGERIYSSEDPKIQSLSDQWIKWVQAHGAYDANGRKINPGEDPLDTAAVASLKEYLLHRDPTLAATMREEEVVSLNKCRHVVLRDSNCTPPRAIIVFDDTSDIYSDSDLIQKLMPLEFKNPWNKEYEKISGAGLIENFDITLNQYRTYKALTNIHYALRHQNEFDNLGKSHFETPYHYRFSGNMGGRAPAIWDSYSQLSLAEVKERQSAEELLTHYAYISGAGDEFANFVQHLTLCGAVHNLIYSGLEPTNTIARLSRSDEYKTYTQIANTRGLTVHHLFDDLHPQNIGFYTKKLNGLIEAEIITAGFNNSLFHDPRILVPAFRAIKDKVNTNEPFEAYLAKVWKACETYFPTLAAAPMPMATDPEPPRTAQGYKTGTSAPEISAPSPM